MTAPVARLRLVVVGLLVAACAPGSGSEESPGSVTAAAASPSPPEHATETSPVTTSPPSPVEPPATPEVEPRFDEFAVTAGDRPHDVAPGPDGRVWYTAQRAGALGVLDPASGDIERVPLGSGSAPHGVIVDADGAPWLTDSGLNAIVHVDPATLEVTTFPLPTPGNANLNTAAFDGNGVLWFTGQNGVYGRLDQPDGAVEVFDAPRGTGPYGIAATPDGTVWFASLAGSYIARIDSSDGGLRTVDVPTTGGGARRVWSDSEGNLWVTAWHAGKLARYSPATDRWQEWSLPGDGPQPYAVFVDDQDIVWVTDFGSDALLRFDPETQQLRSFAFPTSGADVRQLLGRPGEVWGAGSGTDTLLVLHTG